LSSRIKKHIEDNLDKWLVSLLTGFALFFVLYIYKGYNIQEGLSLTGHGLLFRASAFGLLTSCIFFIHEFYLSTFFLITNLRRKLTWVAWEIFAGANGTFLLFNYFWHWTEWDWNGYKLLLFEYTCVTVFPILLAWLVVKVLKQKPAALLTAVSSSKAERLLFRSENGKHEFSLKPESFLFIESADNYIEIFYVSDGKLKRVLQRNSLKNVEADYPENPFLLRCHRSYIVNPHHINQVISLNKQIQLDLGFSKIIPVSQKYQDKIMAV
jgi:hypothetical protein